MDDDLDLLFPSPSFITIILWSLQTSFLALRNFRPNPWCNFLIFERARLQLNVNVTVFFTKKLSVLEFIRSTWIAQSTMNIRTEISDTTSIEEFLICLHILCGRLYRYILVVSIHCYYFPLFCRFLDER